MSDIYFRNAHLKLSCRILLKSWSCNADIDNFNQICKQYQLKFMCLQATLE